MNRSSGLFLTIFLAALIGIIGCKERIDSPDHLKSNPQTDFSKPIDLPAIPQTMPGRPQFGFLMLDDKNDSTPVRLVGSFLPAVNENWAGITLMVNITAIKDSLEYKDACIFPILFGSEPSQEFDLECPKIPSGTNGIKLRYAFLGDRYKGHFLEDTITILRSPRDIFPENAGGRNQIIPSVNPGPTYSSSSLNAQSSTLFLILPVTLEPQPISAAGFAGTGSAPTRAGEGERRIVPRKKWSRTFEGVPIGVGSSDGNVVIIDTRPNQEEKGNWWHDRFELISMSEDGKVFFRKILNSLPCFSADPDWETMLVSDETRESKEKRWGKTTDDDSSTASPTLEVAVINRGGETKSKFLAKQGGFMLVDNAAFFAEGLGEGAEGCVLKIRLFQTNQEKMIGFYGDNRFYLAPDGKHLLVDMGDVTLFDSEGNRTCVLPGHFDHYYTGNGSEGPAMFNGYLVLSKSGHYSEAFKPILQYSLLKCDGEVSLEFFDGGYEGTYEKDVDGKIVSAIPHDKDRAIAVTPDGKTGVILTAAHHLVIIDMPTFKIKGTWDLESVGIDAFKFRWKYRTQTLETLDAGHLRVQDGKAFILGRSAEAFGPLGDWLSEKAWTVFLLVVDLGGSLNSITPLDGKVINAKFSGPGADEIVAWTTTSVDKYLVEPR